jgi:hypothetical protein
MLALPHRLLCGGGEPPPRAVQYTRVVERAAHDLFEGPRSARTGDVGQRTVDGVAAAKRPGEVIDHRLRLHDVGWSDRSVGPLGLGSLARRRVLATRDRSQRGVAVALAYPQGDPGGDGREDQKCA